MKYIKISMLLSISMLFANSDIYNLIEKTKATLEQNQEISKDELYQAAISAYSIEEYKDANSFLRYLVRELDNEEYKNDLNLWVKRTKEIEILTGRYLDDPGEKDNIIFELEELRYSYDFYRNCDLVEETIPDLLANENILEFENCAYIEYNIGKIHYFEEDYSEALKYYNLASLLNPVNRSYANSLNSVVSKIIKDADEYCDFKDYGTCIEIYLSALENMGENNSNYQSLLYKISRAYYYDKEEEQALKYLKKRVDINIETLSLSNIEDEYFDEKDFKALYLMGECYRKLGDPDNAIKSYTCALNAKEDAKAYYKRGTVYFSIENYDKAAFNYEEAIYLKENYHQAYESLGILFKSQNDDDSAIENFKLALEYDPRNYGCWFRLSNAYNDIGDKYNDKTMYQLAKECAEECLMIKRSYLAAYFEIGRAEYGLGRKFAAITNFEKARNDSQYRKIADSEIKNIQKELSE